MPASTHPPGRAKPRLPSRARWHADPSGSGEVSTPLKAEGLSRRVYPFIGLAIVGLVSFHGFAAVTNSLALSGAMAVGVALVLIPLAQIDTPAKSRIVTAIPVVGGFVLALHPLWADGTAFG